MLFRLRSRRLIAVALFAIPLAAYGLAVAERATLSAPKPTPILYDRHGAFLAQMGVETRAGDARRIDYGYWPLATLPERVVGATLALEDRRFWSHPGVDPLALARATWQNLSSGRRVSGASTIAMQVVRMQSPGPRHLWAKAVEAGAAIAITARYGREAVLRQYLRLVPYGNGSHGIAHAARWYLDKPVDDLSWAEIALLSAIPQSPTGMNPLRRDGRERAIRRGRATLAELSRRGVLDAGAADLAARQLAAMPPLQPPRRPDALHPVLRLEGMMAESAFDPADPRIRTALDLRIQGQASAVARRFLAGWRPSGAEQVASMVVARGSREVLASVGSTRYRDHRSGAIDFTRTLRSPGSTLKPFLYALALERGLLKVSDVMADLPEGSSGIGNADGQFLGPMLPRQALANSRNVPATNLLRAVGLETAFRNLRDLGLHDLEIPAESFGLSMAIGSLPTTLDKLVRGYGALADEGVMRDLVWHAGQKLLPPKRVMSADTARLVTLFLADPMARLPSFPRYGPTEFPFPVALKTGTSQGYRDAWVVAWSRDYLVGVWVGRGDAGTMNQLSGARSAARAAHALLLQLHGTGAGDLSETGFPPPEGRVPVELCVYGGKRSDGTCGQTLTEWVLPDEMPAAEPAAVLSEGSGGARLAVAIPASHRGWAKSEGFALDDRATSGEAPALTVAFPEHNSRIWRNPELPPSLNRLALKAVVEPRVEQVVWYVDGEPFAVADPDQPVLWPLQPGTHRFQIRLPHREERSRPVRVVVE